MRTKYKPRAIPFIEENPDIIIFEKDLENSSTFSSFIKRENLYCEIGPGKGSFIIQLASKFPESNFLLVELNKTISAICAKRIKEEKISNVFMVCGDAFVVFQHMENTKFNGIFLNHPDPWPKKRHEHRRLTSKRFLDLYHKHLNENCPLILKHDNYDMFIYSRDNLIDNGWNINFISYNYWDEDDFDAITDYQEKFFAKGNKINRLKATKGGE